MKIEVYGFENRDGTPVTDWTTQDATEAKNYAETHNCRAIAQIYTFDDSELAWDFTTPPGGCPECHSTCWQDDPERPGAAFCESCGYVPED